VFLRSLLGSGRDAGSAAGAEERLLRLFLCVEPGFDFGVWDGDEPTHEIGELI
jgi:hypothetical protein